MEKRYQVFVSSTYEDLREERQEVMHALLELDCMPAGMELFPAANEDQWSLIKKIIDECDYYILISAGRYGSIGPRGESYTEMEYRYAIEQGKPVIAFLHQDIKQLVSGRCEQSEEGRIKLLVFRALVQQKVCKFWDSPQGLGSVVSRSLIRLIRTTSAIGWIRSNQITDATSATEILKLRKKIEELEARLQEARLSAPAGTEKLAQGDDEFSIDYTFSSMNSKGEQWDWEMSFDLSWNRIFYDIGPLMLDEATDYEFRSGLNRMVRERSRPYRQKDEELKGHRNLKNFSITEHDVQTIKIQFRALGLIIKSERNRSVRDNASYWTLTPYGDQILTTLRAMQKIEEDDVFSDLLEKELLSEEVSEDN